MFIYLFFMDFYTFLEDKEDDQLHMKLTQSSSSYEDSTKLGDDSSGSELISEAATSTIVVPINSKVGWLLSFASVAKKKIVWISCN